jgi:hypothetical protein
MVEADSTRAQKEQPEQTCKITNMEQGGIESVIWGEILTQPDKASTGRSLHIDKSHNSPTAEPA